MSTYFVDGIASLTSYKTVKFAIMLSTQKGLSQDNQLFIGKLKQLDLKAIANELMHSTEEKWSFERTKQASSHYSMFLWLVNLYPKRQLVPTQEIDKVWHYHILDTMKYAEDCQMLFGRFVHVFFLQYLVPRGCYDVSFFIFHFLS